MNSYIQLGLDLGLLEKIEINLGNQKFTGYGILNANPPEIRQGIRVPLIDINALKMPSPKAYIPSAEPIPDASKPFTPEQFDKAAEEIGKAAVKFATEGPTAEQLEAQQALARMTGDAPVAEKKKRGRPKKETFTLTEPEAPKAEPATAPVMPEPPTTSDESASVLSMVGESKTLDEWQAPVVEPEPIVILNLDPDFEGKPTADQARDFRTKLTRFADDVLPAAGLVPSQGIGGVRAKIKLYIKKKFGVDDTKLLTVDQWTLLINEIESVVLVSGASAMVKIINDEIGAA